MTNRKTLTCRCVRRVLVGVETEAVRCWACTGFIGDPKGDGGRSLETPHRRDLAGCCNYSAGACIVREGGRCIVLDGKRCGWFEKAVRPAGRLSGRICAVCGAEVGSRRRLCDSCRRAADRRAKREWKRRKQCRKQSQVESFGSQLAEIPANSGSQRGGSDSNGPRVAGSVETLYRRPLAGPEKRRAMRADMGDDGPEFPEAQRARGRQAWARPGPKESEPCGAAPPRGFFF